MSLPYVCVHDLGHMPRKFVNPTLAGSQIDTSHGYVHRKRILIFWATTAQIETAIVNNETSGYSRSTDNYSVTPAIEDGFPLYNAECEIIKYSSS